MENRSNHVLVGGVVMALVVAVVIFLIWIANAGSDTEKEYDIFFQQGVSGLNKGSSVTFSGVPVGQVRMISLMPKTPQFVRVRISVQNDTPIVRGTTATIQGVGFTGVSEIQLEPPEGGGTPSRTPPPLTCPERNTASQCPFGVPVIPTKPGGLGALLNSAPQLLERVSTLTERVTELLDEDNQQSLSAILDNVETISGALADRSPEIAATLAEARIAIRQAGEAAEAWGRVAGSADQLLNEEGRPLINDLRSTIRAADRSLGTLEATINDARPGVQNFSKQTLPEIGQLVRDLRETSDALRSITTRIDQQGAASILGEPKLPDYKR
ncbi:MCE family protein [Allosphingosinicella flava]|uniref:MCE family protein n=1 Tax=Allosphingosinicella flava TaxID=2771430 RepID=A0A7T2GIR0_9SPHN|nr:MlaD family protein [Sphingosinicella flava]QPQ54273.1 MCE family protein [Sphingosinicella flava]